MSPIARPSPASRVNFSKDVEVGSSLSQPFESKAIVQRENEELVSKTLERKAGQDVAGASQQKPTLLKKASEISLVPKSSSPGPAWGGMGLRSASFKTPVKEKVKELTDVAQPSPGSSRAATPARSVKDISKVVTTSSASVTSDSRPATPSIAEPASRKIQPRTLRITDTIAKVDHSISSPIAGSRAGSRRPSMTAARPGSPFSEQVGSPSVVTSASASRAASPTPIASKKRSDKSKKKKEKERQSHEEETLAIAPNDVMEHSPILGRKKKSKKPGPSAPPPKPKFVAIAEPVDEKVTKEPEPEPEPVPKKAEKLPAIATPQKKNAKGKQKASSAKLPANHLFLDLFDEFIAAAAASSSHLSGLSESTPFSTLEDFQNFTSYIEHPRDRQRISSQAAPSWPISPLNGILPDGTTRTMLPEAAKAFCSQLKAQGKPAILQASNGRLSGMFVHTPSGTQLYGLTPTETESLLKLQTRIAEHKGPGFWGGGDPKYLPRTDEVLRRNKAYQLQTSKFPESVVSLDYAETSEELQNKSLLDTDLPQDPRLPSRVASPVPSTPVPAASAHDALATALSKAEELGEALSRASASSKTPEGDASLRATMATANALVGAFDRLERAASASGSGASESAWKAIGGTRDMLKRALACQQHGTGEPLDETDSDDDSNEDEDLDALDQDLEDYDEDAERPVDWDKVKAEIEKWKRHEVELEKNLGKAIKKGRKEVDDFGKFASGIRAVG